METLINWAIPIAAVAIVVFAFGWVRPRVVKRVPMPVRRQNNKNIGVLAPRILLSTLGIYFVIGLIFDQWNALRILTAGSVALAAIMFLGCLGPWLYGRSLAGATLSDGDRSPIR